MKHKAGKALARRYRITDGRKFRLDAHDPAQTGGLKQAEAVERLAKGVDRLADLQRDLYASARWGLLAIFQAMDAGGKDGTIRHVMSGVNPQGVRVTSFKQPGPVELAHDYLWRIHAALPERGQIGIFNRSHYEEVLVARVHPEVLEAQKLPGSLQHDRFWKHRYEDVRNFESYVARQGILPLKFFLHISREEQGRRLLARLDDRHKLWKFSASDLKERARWDSYQEAYERAVIETASTDAPWFIIPADHKWFAHLIVVEAMVDVLERLKLQPPKPEDDAALDAARAQLQGEC